MKTQRFVSIRIFCLRLITLVTVLQFSLYTNGQITSTETGGDWNTPSTWIDEVVPGPNDDVEIIGPVTISNTTKATCFTLTINSVDPLTNNGSLTIIDALSGSGTLTQGVNSLLYIGSSITSTLTATATGNTVIYNGTGGQPINPTTYYKLKLTNSAKTTSSVLIVNDSLIADAQITVNLQSITVNGNAVFNGSATINGACSIGGNAVFNGSANIGGTCTVGGNATFNGNSVISNTLSVTGDLTISNSFSAGYNLSVNGNTTIENTGTFIASGGSQTTITFSGNVIVNGTWSNSNYTTNYEFRKNLTNNGTFNAGSGLYYFKNTSEIVSASPISIPKLKIDGTLQNKSDLSAGNITGTGTFENMSGAILSLTSSSAKILPTLIANTYPNTVNYKGSNQTIKSTSYSTLNLATTATATLIAGGAITTSNFSIAAITTLDLKTYALAITNSAISTAGRILTACTTSTPLSNNINWTGHVTYNSTADQTVAQGTYANLHLTNGGTKTINGAIALTNLEVASGTTLDMTTIALPTASYTGSGTIKTQNTSSTPIPANQTWNYTINYNGTASQTLVNGNYSNIIIDNAAGVSVADSASISSNLTINTGKQLIIADSKKLTSSTITNNAGSNGIYIQSTSSTPTGTLIFNNSPSNPVAATIELYSKAAATSYIDGVYSGYKWQYFGIPISYTSAAPTFNDCYVRKYNEAGIGIGTLPTNYWISVLSNGSLTAFNAYEITQPTPKTITFRGNLVNTNYSSGKLAYTTGATYKGQHLIGNSYTAAINISNIQFGSSDPNVIENTIYFYNTGSYSDWVSNGASGTVMGSTPGQYTSVPVSLAGSDPEIPGQIPAMQAYLVKVNSDNNNATISVPYSSATMRNTTLQRSIKQSIPYTKIKVSGSRYEDKMWIFTNSSCTPQYDNGWDGYKIIGSSKVPQIWSIENNMNLQINTKDNINNSTLGFRYGEDSVYTITVSHTNDNLYTKLYLVDLLDNSTTDISASGTTVTFKANASTPLTRFKIVTALDIATKNEDQPAAGSNIFNEGSKLHIQNMETRNAILKIYDLSGKLIRNYQNIQPGVSVLESNIVSGDYILHFNSGGKEITRKIVVFE